MAEKSKGKSPAWAWLLTGMLIGLFAAFLIYLNDTRGSRPAGAESKAAPPAAAPKAEANPRFDFYTILPDLEIPVPDINEILPDQSARPRPGPSDRPTTTPPTPAGDPGSYVLQVGAFKGLDEADRMKASLALIGVSARIESTAISGVTWHRVRIGPFKDMQQLNDANNRLKQNGMSAMLLKLKG